MSTNAAYEYCRKKTEAAKKEKKGRIPLLTTGSRYFTENAAKRHMLLKWHLKFVHANAKRTRQVVQDNACRGKKTPHAAQT